MKPVLVDSSLWVDFLNRPTPEMREIIKSNRARTHSCVIGEVMVGSVPNREVIREFLLDLPRAEEAEPWEVLDMIEARRLFGKGLQWNDILLLASAKLSGVQLWTRDKRLALAAAELGVGWSG